MTTPEYITLKGRAKDHTGQRFGRLVALGPVGRDGSFLTWKCICDCGNITVVRSAHLRDGGIQSCGCLHRERAAEANTLYPDLGTEQVFAQYRKNFPDRIAASSKVQASVMAGRIPPARECDCFVCGGQAIDYHHVDYTKPLEVFPVCRSCHRRWHIYND